MKKAHKQFIDGLTDEQKKIMKEYGHGNVHKTHGQDNNHDAIAKKMDLTKKQQQLHIKIIELHKNGKEAEMKKAHKQFIDSLTDEQKKIMKEYGYGEK